MCFYLCSEDLQKFVDEAENGVILFTFGSILNICFRFHERMQNLSRVFKDRPMTPQESAAYWTEYVIRYNGASRLQAVGSEMPLYQYLLLDIVLLIYVLEIVALSVLFYMSKKFNLVIVKCFALGIIPTSCEKEENALT